MFGKGKEGMSLQQFQTAYDADPFYHWMGLGSPMMYAAHKAAGGMTSLYRQIGMACQTVFQRSLQDSLGITASQATWSYTVPKPDGKTRKLSLDGRIDLGHVKDTAAHTRVDAWFSRAKKRLAIPATGVQLTGSVFEVRQGYKSKDSKRQNADIANASNSYVHNYMPVLLLFSTQIDDDLLERYTAERWLPLIGTIDGPDTESTYTFCRDVVGYDMAGFFTRNSARIQAEITNVLTALLNP